MRKITRELTPIIGATRKLAELSVFLSQKFHHPAAHIHAIVSQLCETNLVSDAYVDRCSQTFLEGDRDKSTQANAVKVVDAGDYSNEYLIQDEYTRVKEMETKKRIKDEGIHLLNHISMC